MTLGVDFLARDAPDVSELLKNPKHINPYGYYPYVWACAIFVALFGLSTLVHLGQAIWSRKWYLIPTLVLGGCGEIIGWSARLWSAKNVYNPTPFLMQISSTIISPTFLAAANFIILGTIIKRTGTQYSRLSPNAYAIIFISIDVIALVVQAIGGGMASAETQKVGGDPDKGGHVMLIGIIIQLVEIFVYAFLAADFFRHYAKRQAIRRKTKHSKSKKAHSPHDTTVVNSPSDSTHHVHDGELEKLAAGVDSTGRMTAKTKLMSYGLALSTLFLLIRAIYRTIELSNGWEGRIIHTQVYFNVLDGAMVVLAMWTLNFLHPGHLL